MNANYIVYIKYVTYMIVRILIITIEADHFLGSYLYISHSVVYYANSALDIVQQ